jgi:fluoroacetyl-CoA thioesterase
VLPPGLRGSASLVVTDSDTARAIGSGEVQVLATPRVLALAEAATLAALSGALDEDTTSVGSRVELDHLAPSPIGAEVTATAELVEVTGRRLTFDVSMRSGDTLVARARITRAAVPRSRFPG